MSDQSIVRIKNPDLKIDGNMIQCNNHTFQISNISRVWSGKSSKKQVAFNQILVIILMAFIAFTHKGGMIIIFAGILSLFMFLMGCFLLKERYGLNLELNSGTHYSLQSTDGEFILRVYGLMNDIISGKITNADYSIKFTGSGVIVDNLMEMKADFSKKAEEPVSVKKAESQIGKELEMLLIYLKGKDVVDLEAVSLTEEVLIKMESGNREGLKELLSSFISKSLINECNELRLYTLVESIKQNIYM